MSVLLLKGVLLDTGRECEVLAWKETTEGGTKCSKCRVIDAPSDLPDRDYMLRFDGQIVQARKRSGHWLMERFQ
ncbi:MAG TPA: hypothetical protein VGF88_16535 [Acidobacteriaceae bacterium]|jgi:hypothetical protein